MQQVRARLHYDETSAVWHFVVVQRKGAIGSTIEGQHTGIWLDNDRTCTCAIKKYVIITWNMTLFLQNMVSIYSIFGTKYDLSEWLCPSWAVQLGQFLKFSYGGSDVIGSCLDYMHCLQQYGFRHMLTQKH